MKSEVWSAVIQEIVAEVSVMLLTLISLGAAVGEAPALKICALFRKYTPVTTPARSIKIPRIVGILLILIISVYLWAWTRDCARTRTFCGRCRRSRSRNGDSHYLLRSWCWGGQDVVWNLRIVEKDIRLDPIDGILVQSGI